MSQMKSHILLVLLIGLTSCKSTQKEMKKHITVTVIDKKKNNPIGNAIVKLNLVNDVDVNSKTGNTDSTGKCNFSFAFNDRSLGEVIASKTKYYGYFDLENKRPESSRNIKPTDNEIILYLTSDSLHLISVYEKMTPHYQIDTLIQLLASNHYQPEQGSMMPALSWYDISSLLEIGNGQTKITKFPRNGISSTSLDSCYLGILSLWLVESIRINEQKNLINPWFEKFPSQTPYLMKKSSKTFERNPNDVDTMELAYQAYQKWWRTTRSMKKMDACKINPLENTNLYWQ